MNTKRDDTYWNIPAGQLRLFEQYLAKTLGPDGLHLMLEALEDPEYIIPKLVDAWRMALPIGDDNVITKGWARKFLSDNYISIKEAGDILQSSGFSMEKHVLKLPRCIPYQAGTLRRSYALVPILPVNLHMLAHGFADIVDMQAWPSGNDGGTAIHMRPEWFLVSKPSATGESIIRKIAAESELNITQALYTTLLFHRLRDDNIIGVRTGNYKSADPQSSNRYSLKWHSGKLTIAAAQTA